MHRTRFLIFGLIAASLAWGDAPIAGTQPKHWKVFRSDALGFEVNYPNFGHKTRVVPVLAEVPGYSFEYWSNDKHAYCGLFSVMKSEGLPPDPQGLGRDAPVLASRGKWRLTLWTNQDGVCSPDLEPVMSWISAHVLPGRFFGANADKGSDASPTEVRAAYFDPNTRPK